jgi:hypothetical protein
MTVSIDDFHSNTAPPLKNCQPKLVERKIG